jgi:DNA primase
MVRQATDLVRLIGEHVALRPKGREHVGLCPFHDDHSPSFCVVTHKGNAFYKCHSCGTGGDAFDFVKNYHKMEFGEALRYLADRAGITLKPRHEDRAASNGASRADIRKANAFAANYFQRILHDENLGSVARDIIAQRQISDDMVKSFGLGAAPDQWDGLFSLIARRSLPAEAFIAAGLIKPRKNESGHFDMFRNRVIFPICDELGNPVAFGARKIKPDDEPKYLNSAESPIFIKSRTLYGLHLAKRAIIDSKTAIITEGYTDVIACHQAGICNVVGTLGTALTHEHARILSKLCDTVILLFDGDAAGMRAADRGVNVFFNEPVDVKICVLPDELDPDELLKLPDGAQQFAAAIEKSVDAIEYKVIRLRELIEKASSLSGKQKLLEAFFAELVELGFASMQGVRRSLVVGRLSELLAIPVHELERSLPHERARAATAAHAQPASHDLAGFVTAPNEVREVSRARRIAEQELLGILIFEPAAGLEPLELGQSANLPLTERIHVDHFLDASSRAIAQAVFDQLIDRHSFTVQDLLGQLDDEYHRQVASRLYFDGERCCAEHSGSAAQALVSAIEALHACMNLEQVQRMSLHIRQTAKPDESLSALQQLLQHRRQSGDMSSAIAQGVRS